MDRAPKASAGGRLRPAGWRPGLLGPPSHRVIAAVITAAGTALAATYPAAQPATARFPDIANAAAAWASSTARVSPAARSQNLSPARCATHHAIAPITGTNTRYGAKLHQPAEEEGRAPEYPTRAMRPVGSATACISVRSNNVATAATGRRTCAIHPPLPDEPHEPQVFRIALGRNTHTSIRNAARSLNRVVDACVAAAPATNGNSAGPGRDGGSRGRHLAGAVNEKHPHSRWVRECGCRHGFGLGGG